MSGGGEDEGMMEELDPTEALLALTCVHPELGIATLEQKIALALDIASERVSVMELEDGHALFIIVCPEEDTGAGGSIGAKEEAAALGVYTQKLNAVIEAGGAVAWLGAAAKCTVAEMEEDVLVEEQEALNMWREIRGSRTSHLAAVTSPDGVFVIPTHDSGPCSPAQGFVSCTHVQLKRDPLLLELDNVLRVDVSQLGAVSWTEPVVITGCLAADHLTLDTLMHRFGDAEVRTGNRNTLVENGFNNSKPMALRDAMEPGVCIGEDPECSCVVFSPVKELPDLLRQELELLTGAFPCEHLSQGREPVKKKFTLCLGTEGFGIGFHRHNAAMFMLVAGRKKWYMGPQSTEDDTPTHPDFYTTKSSHKCIQQPGEVLYVPDQWYHEIFNFEHTRGIQALPE